MKEIMEKPTSIQTNGKVIAIIAGLMLFGNTLFVLTGFILGFWDGTFNKNETNESNPFLPFLVVGILLVFSAIFNLIGGIQFSKYRLLGQKLIIIGVATISLALILLGLVICSQPIDSASAPLVYTISGVVILLLNIPLVFLIRYLHRSKPFLD